MRSLPSIGVSVSDFSRSSRTSRPRLWQYQSTNMSTGQVLITDMYAEVQAGVLTE